MRLEVIILLWLLYCVIHSGLISITVSRKLQHWMGTHYRFYRLYYNLFSLLTLIGLIYFTNEPRRELILVWSGYYHLIQIALTAIAVVILVLGGRSYNLKYMLGIEQIRNYQPEKLQSDSPIVATGILGFVRHPWYLGVLILLWMSNQDITSMIVNGILSLYLVVGSILEERKLVAEFGSAYREYQSHVSMLFPWKWLKAAIHNG